MMQMNSMEQVQSEASKAHMLNQKLKVRMSELEAQLGAMKEMEARMTEERAALEADLYSLREVNRAQSQQLADKRTSFGE